jgi:hypothetical protein
MVRDPARLLHRVADMRVFLLLQYTCILQLHMRALAA